MSSTLDTMLATIVFLDGTVWWRHVLILLNFFFRLGLLAGRDTVESITVLSKRDDKWIRVARYETAFFFEI